MAKATNNFGEDSIGKIFEVEMLIKILPKTPLQIFKKKMNAQVIVKNIIDTEIQFLEDLLSINGLKKLCYYLILVSSCKFDFLTLNIWFYVFILQSHLVKLLQ